MKILTLFDGTLHAKTALKYGIGKVREKGGELIVLQVFHAAMFVDYDAGPRAEEMARAEAGRHAREAQAIIADAGSSMNIRYVSEDGDPDQVAAKLVEAEQPDLVLVPSRYKALAKTIPAPVYAIPGTILVPVDNSDAILADRGEIVNEAKATGSKVLLLGIVPIHLYGTEEKRELELVQKSTAAAMKKIRKALADQGIDASEAVRSGYPDEEILKAAEESAASLIMLPAGGKTPSELTKAAAILRDEPERVRRPVFLMRPAEA